MATKLARVSGSRGPRRGALRASRDLNEFDRRLIAIFEADGRTSFREAARLLECSEKRVRVRFTQLVEDQVIEVATFTLPELVGYTGMASLGLRLARGASAGAVAESLSELGAIDYVAVVTGRYQLFAHVICRDSTDLTDFIDTEVRTMDTIAVVDTFPFFEMTYVQAAQNAPTPPVPLTIAGADLTDIDRRIIDELVAEGRVPLRSVAATVGASEAHVRQRYKRLVASGILRIVAIVSPASIGLEAGAWIGIKVAPPQSMEATAKLLAGVPEVTYVSVCAGGFDLFIEVLVRSASELFEFVDQRLRQVSGVTGLEVFPYVDVLYKRPRYSIRSVNG
jgi:Lrp/AsnC family transcriptional regulator for asnA, asnC and gidA